ncbi:ECF transporter S component [Methanocorpusculum bavaricum]|uniref:ECF transporter S component n=1 Tax=Methanocorpusculum bavaricum TaxID=71518 RepID=UPI0005B2C20C|nr:ECF transporter S component [Methanocorpusculum bavaricum]
MKPYFQLHEIALLSLLGALIFVLRLVFKIPIHVPGSSGLVWVLPLIIGVGIVRKPGAGLYMGFISGILASFFGVGALHVLDIFKYLAMGLSIDLTSMLFLYRFSNPMVGFIVGAVGNFTKMLVNFAVQMLFGVQATFILVGITVSATTHLIFGGIGGILAVLILSRLRRAGVITEDDKDADN